MKPLIAFLFFPALVVSPAWSQAYSYSQVLTFKSRVASLALTAQFEDPASSLASAAMEIARQEHVNLSGESNEVISKLQSMGTLDAREAAQARAVVRGLMSSKITLNSSLLDVSIEAMEGEHLASSMIVVPAVGMASVIIALAIWKDAFESLPFSMLWPCWIALEVPSDIKGARKYVLGATDAEFGLALAFVDMKTQCEQQAERCGYSYPRVVSYFNLPDGSRKKFTCLAER